MIKIQDLFNMQQLFNLYRLALLFVAVMLLASCSNPQPGPDKTAAGMVLGGAWGAGAGAVVGHNLPGTVTGEGAAVGAGFGAVSGALSGAAYDLNESELIRQEKELAALRVQNAANAQQLARIQNKLDRAITSDIAGGVYQVFFDPDQTSLRAGAIANLETIAESIKASPHAYTINVVGHTDDSGSPEHNERLAEARARTVSAYLASRGISSDRIKVKSFGAKRPIATNATDVGRQLNRRVDIYISRD
ncbi:MAG: OmpA family protein [Candidatus Dadabacteria bacterium]|nr:MAG: OmpA family protein [Candidatus Dadabacteria bacterium]